MKKKNIGSSFDSFLKEEGIYDICTLKAVIKFPVKYEPCGTMILDSENNMVAQVRGWGRISYMDKPEEKQDMMGRFIAESMNKMIKEKSVDRKKYRTDLSQV